jgi:hypothetical protein
MRNRNYFLRFRIRVWFRLLTSSCSGSDFLQVTVPVLAPYVDHKKNSFQKKNFTKILPFYKVNFLTRKKLISFVKFIVKCEGKMLK